MNKQEIEICQEKISELMYAAEMNKHIPETYQMFRYARINLIELIHKMGYHVTIVDIDDIIIGKG